MPWDVGVVQSPAVFIASDLTWLSLVFIVTMGAGRGGSLLNLLLLGLNWKEGVCICCRSCAWPESMIKTMDPTRECVCLIYSAPRVVAISGTMASAGLDRVRSREREESLLNLREDKERKTRGLVVDWVLAREFELDPGSLTSSIQQLPVFPGFFPIRECLNSR
jgi:hypothetical protein